MASEAAAAAGPGDRLGLLRDDISTELARVERRRRKTKADAFGLRMAIVTASAVATVLLGLKVGGGAGVVLTDVALAFSALATVVVAADAFYDPRDLWIMEVVHLNRLRALDRRLTDQIARGGGSLAEDQLDDFRAEFESLMETQLQGWSALRAGRRLSSRA
jgi:hypothetical protein